MEKTSTENRYILQDPGARAKDFTSAYAQARVLAKNALLSSRTLSSSTSSTDKLLETYWLSTASKILTTSFLSIDLRNFTVLSNTHPTEELSQAVVKFSRAVANIAGLTGGYVLKYVGDAVLCFFPTRSIKTSIDRALIAAGAIKMAMEEVILPAFKEEGINTNFGIGLDCGNSSIIKVGSSSTKLHYDLIGKPINFSVKLQSSAKKGEILATSPVYEMSSYQELFEEVSLDKHPSGIKGALLKATNIIFRSKTPEKIYKFNPPKQDDF